MEACIFAFRPKTRKGSIRGVRAVDYSGRKNRLWC